MKKREEAGRRSRSDRKAPRRVGGKDVSSLAFQKGESRI